MKFLKKYGIYVLLVSLAATLIAVGSKNTSVSEDKGKTYVPAPIIEKPASIDEPFAKSAPVPETIPEDDVSAAEEIPIETATINNLENEVITEAFEEPEPLAFKIPVKGEITKDFSDGKMVYSEVTNDFRTHNGIDITADENADVYAAAYGTVISVKDDVFWGETITIDHGGGLQSRYCGLSECLVSEGDTADNKFVIGKVGKTAKMERGMHLHFEVIKDGKYIDPKSLFY